ncbi:MAG: hypothetical protein L3J44_07815 [Campylobacteraceae bacterium]|nr:hypothetical protein [Campylobacteraceae bacterium]
MLKTKRHMSIKDCLSHQSMLKNLNFLADKIAKEQQAKLDRLMKYAGKGEVHDRFDNLTSSQIREQVAKEKYGAE